MNAQSPQQYWNLRKRWSLEGLCNHLQSSLKCDTVIRDLKIWMTVRVHDHAAQLTNICKEDLTNGGMSSTGYLTVETTSFCWTKSTPETHWTIKLSTIYDFISTSICPKWCCISISIERNYSPIRIVPITTHSLWWIAAFYKVGFTKQCLIM